MSFSSPEKMSNNSTPTPTPQQFSRKTIPQTQLSKKEKKKLKKDTMYSEIIAKRLEISKNSYHSVMQWKYLLNDVQGGPDYAKRFFENFPDAKKSECGNYYVVESDDGKVHGFPMYLFEEKPGEPQHLPNDILFQKLPSLVMNPVRRWFVKRTPERLNPNNAMHVHVFFDPLHQLVENASDYSKYITVGPTVCPIIERNRDGAVENNGFVSLYINRKQTTAPGERYVPEPLIVSMLDVDLHSGDFMKVSENKYGKQTTAIGVGGWEYQLEECTKLLGEYVENKFRWLYRERKDVRPNVQKYMYKVESDFTKDGEEFMNELTYKSYSPYIYAKFGGKITFAIHGKKQEGYLTPKIYNHLIQNDLQADMTFKIQLVGKFDNEEQVFPCLNEFDEGQSNHIVYNELIKKEEPMIKAVELKIWFQFHLCHVNFHPKYEKNWDYKKLE